MDVKSAQEIAYKKIRTGIASGQFETGQRLVEAQLAEKLGVTRGPIREALCRLEHDGLVERVPGIGVFVNDFDTESLVELCEIRAALESLAARKAASQCDELGAIKLRRELGRLRRIADSAGGMSRETCHELYKVEEDLHHLITEVAEMPQLARLLANQHIIRRMFRAQSGLHPATFEKTELEGIVERHSRLVEAIIAHHERDADRLAREHVMRTVRTLQLESTAQ